MNASVYKCTKELNVKLCGKTSGKRRKSILTSSPKCYPCPSINITQVSSFWWSKLKLLCPSGGVLSHTFTYRKIRTVLFLVRLQFPLESASAYHLLGSWSTTYSERRILIRWYPSTYFIRKRTRIDLQMILESMVLSQDRSLLKWRVN